MAAQPAALRLWMSPDDLAIDDDSQARSELWPDDQQPRRDGMRLWQRLIELQPVPAGANGMTLDLDIPEQLAMGLNVLPVQRMVQTLDPVNPGVTRGVCLLYTSRCV